MEITLQTARKILLCLRYGIGDLVMELPAIETLRRMAPAAQITALGAEPALELLAGDSRIDRLVSVQTWGLREWGDPGTPPSREAIRCWLAEEQFDVVLDPTHAVRGVGQAIWHFSPPILDTGSENQDAALAHGACGVAAVKEAVRLGWGIDIPQNAAPRLNLTVQEMNFAASFLQSQGVIGTPVGLSPVASSPLKRWSAEGFADLARQLTAAGFDLLLFTGPQPQSVHDPERDNYSDGRIAPVGPLHLRQIAALLASCRLFIGHDTGLMHMAAAAGTPLVALFGPTSPAIYLPDQVPVVSLGGRDSCRWRRTVNFGPPPCVAENRCLEAGRNCINRIEIEDVWQAVRLQLGATSPATGRENRSWPT